MLIVSIAWQRFEGLSFRGEQMIPLASASLARPAAWIPVAAVAIHKLVAQGEDTAGGNHVSHACPDGPAGFIRRRHANRIRCEEPIGAMPPVVVQKAHRCEQMWRPGLQIVARLEVDLQVPHVDGPVGERQHVVQHAAEIDAAGRLVPGFRVEAMDHGFRERVARLRFEPMYVDSAVHVRRAARCRDERAVVYQDTAMNGPGRFELPSDND